MNSAMSPTTLLDGVTLTMSPNNWFASAYAVQISGQRVSSPRLFDCWRRFVYWPPGISC